MVFQISRRGLFGMGAAGAIGASVFSPSAMAYGGQLADHPGYKPNPADHDLFYAFDTGVWNGFQMTNAAIKVNHPIKDERSPFFTEGIYENPSLPWEPRFDNGYPNVIYDENAKKYRCYYTLFIKDPSSTSTPREERLDHPYLTSGRVTGCAYAESDDGIHWVKPKLGVVDLDQLGIEGLSGRDNNLLFTHVQGTGVLYDKDDPDPNRRYKLVTLQEKQTTSLCVAFSADGIHFSELLAWPESSASPSPGGDCHNSVFIDPASGEYILITRLWDNGVRVSAISRSRDFYNWTPPVELARGNGFSRQIYSMPVFASHGIYLGLASLLHHGDRSLPDFDTVTQELYWSTNLAQFAPVSSEDASFIVHGDEKGGYPDGDFDASVIFASLPLEVDGSLVFYYMGGKGRHTSWRETALGRATIEKDKFAALTPRDPASVAICTTERFNLHGGAFEIMADISAQGSIRCAVYDQSGKNVEPGYEADACELKPLSGSWYSCTWSGKDLSSLNDGKDRVFVIELHQADLWAIRGDVNPRELKYSKAVHSQCIAADSSLPPTVSVPLAGECDNGSPRPRDEKVPTQPDVAEEKAHRRPRGLPQTGR